MELEFDPFDLPLFGSREEIFSSFERRIVPFKKSVRRETDFPYLGEKDVKRLMEEHVRAPEVALYALAAAFLAQTPEEQASGQTRDRDRRGFQGSHAAVGTDLAEVLVHGDIIDLQNHTPVRGFWQFDGVRFTDPVEAAVAMGRRYSKLLNTTLRTLALSRESPEERERIRSKFNI